MAAPASCIRVHTRQPMHQRRRSHVAGYTALLLLHSRDIHTAHTAVPTRGTHAATTPARQHTNTPSQPLTPPSHSTTPCHHHSGHDGSIARQAAVRIRDSDRCRRHDTQQRDIKPTPQASQRQQLLHTPSAASAHTPLSRSTPGTLHTPATPPVAIQGAMDTVRAHTQLRQRGDNCVRYKQASPRPQQTTGHDNTQVKKTRTHIRHAVDSITRLPVLVQQILIQRHMLMPSPQPHT